MDDRTIWSDLGKQKINTCVTNNQHCPDIKNQKVIIRLENLVNEIIDNDEYDIIAVKTNEDETTKFYNTGVKYQNNKMFINDSEVITGLFYEIN